MFCMETGNVAFDWLQLLEMLNFQRVYRVKMYGSAYSTPPKCRRPKPYHAPAVSHQANPIASSCMELHYSDYVWADAPAKTSITMVVQVSAGLC